MSKKLILLLIVFGVIAGFSSLASALPLIGAVDRSGGASGDRDHIGVYTGEDDPLPTEPGGWTLGNYCFSDRDYRWCDHTQAFPAEMDGAEQICTFNSDKGNLGTVTYTVTFPIGATVLLAADDRFSPQQAYVDSIVTNFAAAGEFTDTGWDVHVHENDTTHRPLSVYSAVLEPGTYVFRGANEGGNNFYVIGALDYPTNPRPSNPDPADGATNVPVETNLTWKRGDYAIQDDVYFGTDPCALPHVGAVPSFELAEFDPGDPDLVASTTYYWQVVDTDGNGVRHPGPIWDFSTISGKATVVGPLDGEVVSGAELGGQIYQTLDFAPGATTVSYIGYCSEFYNDVLDRAENANLGPRPYPATYPYYRYYVGLSVVEPYTETLERGKFYYWCVDGIDAKGNKFAGDVWQFGIQDIEAFAPSPSDGAIFIRTDVLLSWLPGFGPAATDLDHDVYIGTDFDAVKDANWLDDPVPPEYMGFDSEPNYLCSGLENETTYYWRIDEVWGRVLPFSPGEYNKGHVWSFTTGGPNPGLAGEYYHWVDPSVGGTGNPGPSDPFQSKVLVRIDPNINFDFDTDPPPGVDNDGFSIRWTGQLAVPQPGENYTFTTQTDDGVRLWVDDQLIIDQWINQGPTLWSGSIQLDSFGPYNIKMEYYENGGGAVARLNWESPSTPYGIIPSNYLAPSSEEAKKAWTAYGPYPRDGSLTLDIKPTLSWGPGRFAATHELYFGTDFDEVSERLGTPIPLTDPCYPCPTNLEMDQTYYWAVDEVNSLGPDPGFWKGDVWSFTPVSTGYVVLEWWLGIGGTAVADLTNNARYPNEPDGSELITIFEGPTDWANDYGSRIHGWLRPPTTGDYTFWIATDDNGELWLSTSEDPADANLISWVTAWANPRDWDDVDVVPSDPINLVAGKKYYISALMKEGGGGDNLAAAWQGPGIPREVIDGQYLSATPYDPPQATNPNPTNGATDVEDRNPLLSWYPGCYVQAASGHMLYFSPNFADVNERRIAAYIGALNDPCYPYPPPPLLLNQTYYWVVDEVNSLGPAPNLWKGRVWSFTTSECVALDNMEEYNDRTQMRDVWTDGYANVVWGGEEPHWILIQGGSSGSNLNASSEIGGYNEAGNPSTGPIHGGDQAMAFYYDNDGDTCPPVPGQEHRAYDAPYYSEIEADTVENLGVSEDWTAEGVKALTLWYQGHPPSDGSYEWVTESGGAFRYTTLNGRGRDIWGRHDEFYFLGFYPLVNTSGCEFQTRVVRMDPTDPWAKAGVMMREKMTPYSRYAAVFVTPGNGVTFQWRDEEDGDSLSVRETGLSAPIELKLERASTGAFKASYFRNGVWEDVNDAAGEPHIQPIPDMNDSLHAGLAVTSHNADLICSADFNDLGAKMGATPGFPPWGFIGNVGLNDAEPMYVALKDGSGRVSVVNNPDPNASITTSWQDWNIPLTYFTSLDFNSVKKVYIGLGDRDVPLEGGSGILYIDDIRVCPPRCVPSVAKPYADIGGPDGAGDGYYDCVVDEADIGILLGDWLLPDEYITAVAPSEPNLLLHWAFDEGSGTTAIDSAGVVNGVISGATYSSPGPDGSAYCLDFDGGGDYVYVFDGNDANNLLGGLSSLTVSMWIKSDVINTDKGFIIASQPSGGDNSITMRYDSAGASHGGDDILKMAVSSSDELGEDGQQLESSEDLQTTNWQHVCMTWVSGGLMRFYVDGLEDTPTGRNNENQGGTTSGITALLVGKGGKDGAADAGWDGRIDDVRIYDYPLSKEEVAYIATNGGAGIHIPIDSPANLYNAESPGSQWINFRDYSIIAGSWLEKILWP